MLAKRIIPIILNRDSSLVKGKSFSGSRVIGHAYQASRIFAARGVDELIILDVQATKQGKEPDYKGVKELAESCFSPLTVGGGITNRSHIRNLLNSGADKVSLCSAALMDKTLIQEFSASFGRQCITIAIDVKNDYVSSHCGTVIHDIHPIEWAKQVELLGAGEILLTDVSRDGTMEGYNLALIRQITDVVNIPVIANGGCGSYADMVSAIESGADAVAAGALWSFSDATPKEAALYLQKHNIEVRV